MYADLLHYYQVNLLDVFLEEPTLTPRAVLWLVEHLPEDSATIAAVKGGPEFRVWTSQLHLLAAQTNMLYAANRQRSGKATKSGLIKPPKAKGVERRRVANLGAIQARLKREELSRKLHELAKQAEK